MQVCRHYSKDIRYDYVLILDYKQTIYYFSVGDEIDLTDLLTWCQMVLKGYPFFSIKDLCARRFFGIVFIRYVQNRNIVRPNN
jgi:hypothetical protein